MQGSFRKELRTKAAGWVSVLATPISIWGVPKLAEKLVREKRPKYHGGEVSLST